MKIQRTNIIGVTSLLIMIFIIISYLRDMFNISPMMIGEKEQVTAYITSKEVVPRGKGMVHKLEYYYTINNKVFKDHYYSNREISKLAKGDSLIVEVSKLQPDKNKIIKYFTRKR